MTFERSLPPHPFRFFFFFFFFFGFMPFSSFISVCSTFGPQIRPSLLFFLWMRKDEWEVEKNRRKKEEDLRSFSTVENIYQSKLINDAELLGESGYNTEVSWPFCHPPNERARMKEKQTLFAMTQIYSFLPLMLRKSRIIFV